MKTVIVFALLSYSGGLLITRVSMTGLNYVSVGERCGRTQCRYSALELQVKASTVHPTDILILGAPGAAGRHVSGHKKVNPSVHRVLSSVLSKLSP